MWLNDGKRDNSGGGIQKDEVSAKSFTVSVTLLSARSVVTSDDFNVGRSLITSALQCGMSLGRQKWAPSSLSSPPASTLFHSARYTSPVATPSSLYSPPLCTVLSLLSSPRLVLSSTVLSSPLSDTNPCLYFPGDVIWDAAVLLVEAILRLRASSR